MPNEVMSISPNSQLVYGTCVLFISLIITVYMVHAWIMNNYNSLLSEQNRPLRGRGVVALTVTQKPR